MSWHKAAAVLVLAIAPTLATAAYAKDPQRHHRAGPRLSAEVRHHHGHHARRHDARRHRAVRAVASVGGTESGSFGMGQSSSGLVALAQQYNGTNPIGWASRWCAAFANMILQRAGHSGSGSATARSFARYGRPAPGPAPGVIAVWPHHVGFVIGPAGPGKIRVVSGNHGRRVAEGVYSTRSVIAYRYPA
jgi:uncharacterized protein (TIGR02594 family)